MQEDTKENETEEQPKKKRTYVKDLNIKELAKEIINDNRELHSKRDKDDPEVRKMFQDVPVPKKEDTEKPVPVQLIEGYSADTAIHIKHERDIHPVLNVIFKPLSDENVGAKHLTKDGEWTGEFNFFVLNESPITKNGKPFKVLLVEDSNGFRYNIWFDMSNTTLLGRMKR